MKPSKTENVLKKNLSRQWLTSWTRIIRYVMPHTVANITGTGMVSELSSCHSPPQRMSSASTHTRDTLMISNRCVWSKWAYMHHLLLFVDPLRLVQTLVHRAAEQSLIFHSDCAAMKIHLTVRNLQMCGLCQWLQTSNY